MSNPIFEKVSALEGQELFDFMKSLHPVDAYITLRDALPKDKLKSIEVLDEFKILKKQWNDAFVRSNTSVTYGDLEFIINKTIAPIISAIYEIRNAVNNIEDIMGIPMSEWKGNAAGHIHPPVNEEEAVVEAEVQVADGNVVQFPN